MVLEGCPAGRETGLWVVLPIGCAHWLGEGVHMRLILSFVVASAFLVAGLYVLFIQAFTARFLTIRGIGLGIVLTFVGCAWLWADFIRPMLHGEEIG